MENRHICPLAQHLEEELNKYWLENTKRKTLAAVTVAPCSEFQGMALQPPPPSSQPPVGEGRKAGVGGAVLTQGRLLLEWVMTVCLTHWGRRSAPSEWKKPAPLLAAFIIQNFPQPGACTGGGGGWEGEEPSLVGCEELQSSIRQVPCLRCKYRYRPEWKVGP